MAPARLALIDNAFPNYREGKGFSGRKHTEFVALMELLPEAFTVCPPQKFTKSRGIEEFERDRTELLRAHPGLDADRVTYCGVWKDLRADLAYCVFPHYARSLLPVFEANAIPFAFTLYPGGGFLMWGNKREKSDDNLRALFSSPYFAGVFVHHRIIRDYIDREFSVGPKIQYFKGGFSQVSFDSIPQKTWFGFDRDVMNICFVANRYDEKGLGKGYDIFIEFAKRLARLTDRCRFHIVGDWNPEIIDVSGISHLVTFHGYLIVGDLVNLYSQMDVICSPTRIDIPVEGKFDGFPLVVDAGMCGVAMFVSDPLEQNEDFIPGRDIEVIRSDPDDLVERLLPYFSNPEALKDLAVRGQERMMELRNKEEKLSAKAKRLSDIMSAARG